MKRNVIRSLRSILSSILILSLVVTIAPVTAFEVKAEEMEKIKLSNPYIVADSSMEAGQKVTWDCVWFGKYPQREVISEEMSESYISENTIWYEKNAVIIDNDTYKILKNAVGWNDNNDITINGTKYRRLRKKEAANVISGDGWYAGYFWPDDIEWHYFKYEPIKWRVLRTDGKQALLMADVSLDVQKYYARWEDYDDSNAGENNWKDSTIRNWLNQGNDGEKGFVDSAFTLEEQTAIINSTVENNVTDKIFLLSKSEIWDTSTAESYGFTGRDVCDEARQCKSSTYAKAMGINISKDPGYIGYTNWWIRPANGSTVGYDGKRQAWGDMISISALSGVRPVLNLNLSVPEIYLYAGTVCSDGTVKEKIHKKSIAVFTTEKSMRIKTGKNMWMGFGLLDEDSGSLDDKWKKMSVVVSDPTVIALSDYTETEYGYSLEVTGKKQGASNITITDTESGISTIVTVFVQDAYVNTYSYAIDNIASFYPNNEFEKNIETNIYNLNGLYVNKYQCVKSKDFYNISFDVYNSKYYSGAVDIYDENGMWMGYKEIDKYSNISGFWDTGEQAYFLISDMVTGKRLTYEQASFSKYTHIDIEVPEGGYFTISNNVSESPGTFFIIGFEILFEGTSTMFDLFKSNASKESALTSFKKEAQKSFATRLIEAHNEGLKDNVKRQAQKIMLDSMKSKIRTIMKESIKSGLKDKLTSTDTMCSDIASLAEDMLAPHSFNIEWKPMFQSATGIGESFFIKFSGTAGIALKGCFDLNDSTNKILAAKQMVESAGNPYVTIFSSVDTGYINPYGVIVDTNGNMDAESVLQVFRVSDSDAIEVLLDGNNPLEIHELYNICFVKDDTLVQPNGKVTVHIPIPKGMKGNTCKVYRQEKNGSWTILDAKVQGNYLVFETEHFSLYALIGESDNLVITSLPNKTDYKDGEILDTTGLVLDLNGQSISEGYICEPTVLSGNGKKFVKVIYGHSVTKFEVNVEKESPTVSSIAIGTKTTVGKMKYKVTKVNNNDTGEVTLIGTTKKKSDTRFTSLKVGNTVKIEGKSFKITAIGNNAFRSYKKLKSVTVGKNIKKIGTKAFYGCKKLKKIVLKTKQLQANKIGNKAFKGIHSKVNIKVPRQKLKAYKKILKAKGVGKHAKIHI